MVCTLFELHRAFADVCVEIGRCLREVDSCLRLLLPTPEEFHPTLGLSPPTPPAGSSPDRAPSLCGEEDSAVFSLPSTSSGSDDTAGKRTNNNNNNNNNNNVNLYCRPNSELHDRSIVRKEKKNKKNKNK